MRIFVTHILPPELGLQQGISVAATNFSLNLISGGIFDKTYSIAPSFVNQKFPHVLDKRFEIVSSKIRNTKLHKFAALKEQWDLFSKIPRNADVWLYNITNLNVYLIRLLRLFKPTVRIFAIILDFTPGNKKHLRTLPLINSCDGIISLSTSELFNKKNYACLPGVVPFTNPPQPFIDCIKPEFLISGQLSDNISMLSTLLDVFKNLPQAKLHITGKTPQKAYEYARQYNNIICHGELSFDKYIELMHSIPFMLSTRDPKMPENQCNFPSKIIEGLLHNRIIMSTIDYPQLKGISYIKMDTDNLFNDFAETIVSDKSQLLPFANQSEIIQNKFSTEVWRHTMTRIENNAPPIG